MIKLLRRELSFTTTSLYDEKFASIKSNLQVIRENIATAAANSGRSESDVRLMAVTKTVDPVFINYSIDECGVDLIGENKVQELLLKKDSLHLDGVEKHLIGHLQTNKVGKIISEVDMIQSADSLHLIKEISKRALSLGKTSHILLEVNIGDENSKTGFDRGALYEALFEISQLPFVEVNGIMTIPPICEDEKFLCEYFFKTGELFGDIKEKKLDNFNMNILSMGMSGDYELAIKYGSNMVRIGSAIYGARIYKNK